MLKNKNTTDNPQNTSANTAGTSQIVAGTVIEGKLKIPGDLRLEGEIIGDVNSEAKVVMGKTGIIDGNVKARNLDIRGKFTGELNISETLQIRSDADIQGNINTKNLVVENGAKLSGNCNVGGK